MDPSSLDPTMIKSNDVVADTRWYTYKLSGLVWSRMASELCFGGAEPPSTLIVNVIPIPNGLNFAHFNFNAILVDNDNYEIHLRKVVIGDAVDDDGLPIATISHVAMVHRIETLAHHDDVLNAMNVMMLSNVDFEDRIKWRRIFKDFEKIVNPSERKSQMELVQKHHQEPLIKTHFRHKMPRQIVRNVVLDFLGNSKDPTTLAYMNAAMDGVMTQEQKHEAAAKRYRRT